MQKNKIFKFVIKSTEIDYIFKIKNLLCAISSFCTTNSTLQVAVYYKLPASLAFEICP